MTGNNTADTSRQPVWQNQEFTQQHVAQPHNGGSASGLANTFAAGNYDVDPNVGLCFPEGSHSRQYNALISLIMVSERSYMRQVISSCET